MKQPQAFPLKKFLLFASLLITLTSSGQIGLKDTSSIAISADFPSFLRQGDRLELIVHLHNNSQQEITGQVQLELIDKHTGSSVDGWFINSFPNQYFTIAAAENGEAKFPVQVPHQFNSVLEYRISVSAQGSIHSQTDTLSILSLLPPKNNQLSHAAQPRIGISAKVLSLPSGSEQQATVQLFKTMRLRFEISTSQKLGAVNLSLPLPACCTALDKIAVNGKPLSITSTGNGEAVLKFPSLPAGKTIVLLDFKVGRSGFFNTGSANLMSGNKLLAVSENIELNVD